jgi:hypothetical protein
VAAIVSIGIIITVIFTDVNTNRGNYFPILKPLITGINHGTRASRLYVLAHLTSVHPLEPHLCGSSAALEIVDSMHGTR